MNKPINGAYDPKKVEDRIYRLWEESGFFNPDNLPHRPYPSIPNPFTIIMPPPNANGALHIGHAVFVTLQDIMIRFQRMRGRKTLWLPGADHAGFETQVVFEKKLEKEGRNRFQIPRDQLFREMWDFTMANKKVMENQLRKLGASCDWSREKFTLDPDVVAIVTETFAKLYDDGLIYRGERIVNWCVKHQTALSDLEVKYEERSDPLYYIRYGPLMLATVRPETKFGDTAVAVHPGDKRYQKYIGKDLEIKTLLGPAKIKVIADEAVDPHFGTGVVKVTPAHDPDDFEIGQRHGLEVRQVIGKDGRLNEKTGPYAGLKVAEARKKVAEDMQARGLTQKVDATYKHNVAVCYKCGNVLEPLVMPQWFMRMTAAPHAKIPNHKSQITNSSKKSLRDVAVEAVKSGKIKFVPKRFEKVFFHWMKNIRDWNISRQITWGIRIPAWFCVGCCQPKINPKIKGNWFFIRHGETDWNLEQRIQGHQGTSLNERGRKQAREAARQLKGSEIDLIISSDLARAHETADVIGKELGVEVIVDKALRERSYGVLEGTTVHEIAEEREKMRNHEYAPHGGESAVMVETRVHEALLHHRANHKHRNIVIVSHGAALKSLMRRLKNVSFEDMRDVVIGNAAPIHFSVADECRKCSSDFVEQDPDVLDTWFSSGQWPFATLLASRGSKSKIKNQKSKLPWTTKDFKTFYPTDVLETGWDILFFWVARMIMFGLYRTGQVPFHTVYLHGLVRDKDRQKMSKSKGNVIDPLGVAELYGTDAVRMALTVGNLPGNDIIISEEKIRGYRNFANKLWNIHRFIVMHYNLKLAASKPKFSSSDKKRLTEFESVVKKVTGRIESYQFHHAAETVYHYAWHTFADKIIEEAKPRLNGGDSQDKAAALKLLIGIHSTILKLLHPFMPFVTEELWGQLQEVTGTKKRGLLMVEPWPEK